MSIDGISNSMPPMGPPPGAKPPSAAEMTNNIISDKDTDANGALSIEESGLTQETFDVLDTNEDGVVSQNELLDSLTEKLEAMKENMPPMGPPPMRPSLGDSTNLEQLLAKMDELGSSMAESTAPKGNMYSMVLQQMGASDQDQESFFQILKNNGIDYHA